MSFHVDPQELLDAAAEMQRFETWWENAAEQLDSLMNNLHIVWYGRAAEEQKQAHRRWRAGSEHMREALAELRASATGAHRNYTAAGEASTRMWKRAR